MYEAFFDVPPPSPPQIISFNADDWQSIDIYSPERKRHKIRGPAKKRKKGPNPTSSASTSSHSSQPVPVLSEPRPPDPDMPIQMGTQIDEASPGRTLLSDSELPGGDIDTSVDYMGETGLDGAGLTSQGSNAASPYMMFVEAVFTGECDFWQLSRNLFIVNGWCHRTKAPTWMFYHLQMVVVGIERKCHCLCPEGKKSDDCFHTCFLQEYGDEMFPVDHRMTGKPCIQIEHPI